MSNQLRYTAKFDIPSAITAAVILTREQALEMTDCWYSTDNAGAANERIDPAVFTCPLSHCYLIMTHLIILLAHLHRRCEPNTDLEIYY